MDSWKDSTEDTLILLMETFLFPAFSGLWPHLCWSEMNDMSQSRVSKEEQNLAFELDTICFGLTPHSKPNQTYNFGKSSEFTKHSNINL